MVNNKKILLTILFVLGAFGLGFTFRGYLTKSPAPAISAPTVSPETKKEEFPFINKAVMSGIGKHFIINFKPLKTEIEKIQKKYPQKTYIYFSYLNSGSWIGLNEREEFTAASVIKVPLAMSLMKAVEEGKLKLSDSYSLEQLDLDSGFGDLYKVGADQEFTVEELLKIMLEQSDNTAMKAIDGIFSRIGIEDPLGNVYGFLGWEFTQSIPELGEVPDYSKINLKTLSNLFIALYDAKYISVENSNKILEYLANTPFNDRIAAGVPEGVTVSHKIGTAAGNNTYSDCGIVYVTNRNYILCLGSNGGDEKRAAKFMAEISSAVYKYVIDN